MGLIRFFLRYGAFNMTFVHCKCVLHINYFCMFLVHMRWKLKWAFLITFCPSSVWHKASLVVGDLSLVCSNEGPRPIPRGDKYEEAKIHWRNKKLLFSRTTEQISINVGKKHPWVMGIQVSSNEEPINSHEFYNAFFFS